MSAIPNEAINAEIIEDDDNKDIVLKKITDLKTVVKTSPLIQEYKEVSEIDINLPVDEIAKDFIQIEKGYKAFRKNINLVTKTRKSFTAPALAYQKECIQIEKDIVSVLEPYSLKLKALKDKVEQEEARKQREAEEAEEKRIDEINRRLAWMERLPLEMMSKSSLEIREFLGGFDTPEEKTFEEFYDKALILHSQIQTQLSKMADDKELVENAQKLQAEKEAEAQRLKEEEDKKLQAQKDELARQQAEFQKQKEEFEAQQRAMQEEADRKEAARLADELQRKQEEEMRKRNEERTNRFARSYDEAKAIILKIGDPHLILEAIVSGSVPHIRWVD